MNRTLRRFTIAVQFLTVVPVAGDFVREEGDLGGSLAFYPLVGLLIGALALGLYRLASLFFAPAVSLAVAYVAAILLTGGLHIDGFADMCDGFYAGRDKAGILAIMKDSHIGTMAVLGIFCLLLLKLALFYSLFLKGFVIPAFLAVPAFGRWVMAVAASAFPYARAEGGTGKPFVENAGRREMGISSLLLLGIAYFTAGWAGILVSAATLALAFLFMRWVKAKIGGVTGDVLGGLNEISEVCALLLFNLAFPILGTGRIS